MARTVTLSQLRTDIRNQADIVGESARHSDTLLLRLINQSIQYFRRKLSIEGAQHYLTNAAGLLGSGTTSPFPFYVLNISAFNPGVVRVFGVDITVQSSVYSLTHVPFTSRNDYGNTNTTGTPVAWTILQTAKLAILPASDQPYPYNVWYLPVLADLEEDADEFDGVEGWEEFIVWDVTTKLIMRDQYPAAFQMAVEKRNEMLQDIISSAKKVTGSGGQFIGRDVLAERLNGLGATRRRILPPP